ncbi:MAG: hypothetical protein ACJA1A_003377 [Saprospiraceae bacterium]|jgi:hypothetical protein|tara:strand:+ start:572 stop:712 length:141 start_codon:yes stop_codon:yes gene_type:complete
MKRLLLGITLLAIILIAVLCKPIDNTNEEVLLQSNKVEIVAGQSSK